MYGRGKEGGCGSGSKCLNVLRFLKDERLNFLNCLVEID